MIKICIHGHFYQPSRVNPWTDHWDPQPTAAPFRDWNDRIATECYAPNSAARLLDESGTTRATKNNYRFISFNFGPTLLKWMQKNRPNLLRSIAQSDKDSIGLHGHGTAMAQAYHHPILPLCDPLDKRLEIKWGLDAFEVAFKRKAEGLWMPETAMDTATLEEMSRQGVRFAIVDSHQIHSYKTDADSEWIVAENEDQILGRSYWVDLPSGRKIQLVPYSRHLSHGVAFGGWLDNGGRFANELIEAGKQTGFVILATDGESYGHHHRLGEMALAYAIEQLEKNPEVEFTNIAGWLKESPPTRYAKIREPSSWSCAHGIERWRSDCGCAMAPHSGQHQRWRGPFREALELLRDQAREALNASSKKLFHDPEQAREAYGGFLAGTGTFYDWYAIHKGETHGNAEEAQKHLECVRHLLAMFTSCAWFFDEATGLEPQQNIRHAACAIGLVKELTGEDLSPGFIDALATIPVNNDIQTLIQTVEDFQSREQHPTPRKADFDENLRVAGILHPITAFTCPGPIGTLDGGREFVDWMCETGLEIWQILPVCPSDSFGSPYSSWSALSGDPTLVGLRWLGGMKLLDAPNSAQINKVDYSKANTEKLSLVLQAATRLLDDPNHWLYADLQDFIQQEKWALDAALFRAIWRAQQDQPWWEWPQDLRDKDPVATGAFSVRFDREIKTWQTALFLFERQWQALRNYANSRGIKIVGDMPIYVARNSVDVWANRELFQLDENGQPSAVAGVPPDAYSDDGQLWGNPLFDWKAMRTDGYNWWIQRVERSIVHCDILRIDHFVGFSRYWRVPADAETAQAGVWTPGPGREVFDAIRAKLGHLPVIVEDLGQVDQGTHDLRDALELPGMRVLQFGLDGDENNLHNPKQYPPRCIAYTSTHDSPTAAGWWEALSEDHRNWLDFGSNPEAASERMVHEVFQSQASWAIVPLADILGLGKDARINQPGTIDDNWTWRHPTPAIDSPASSKLRTQIQNAGRFQQRHRFQ